MQILIVAATQQEVQPLITHFCLQEQVKGHYYFSEKINVLLTGVGMVATTYALTKHLAKNNYDLVINAGIAGAFDSSIALGSAVQITSDCFAELGAEDGEEFLSIFNMGFVGTDDFPFTHGKLHASYLFKDIPTVDSITVNKVHGNVASIHTTLQRLTPQTESMEGAAVFYVCLQDEIPCAQIRAISNYVERRNKENWDIPLAIKNVNEVMIKLLT